jgi:serine/threonine-protein kinase
LADAEHKIETTRLGSYEIIGKLARGGMAELFLARSVGPEGFEKLVVLKKILPRYAQNPRFVQLFLDEAKLAAGLDHPHIAHVYDMGRADGHYFFTMEYVHGQDLRSILRRSERTGKHVPVDVAVQLARNVASALHHAHERRRPDGSLLDIVHRDVSPSNILVSYDGATKLADFGVAKAASSSVRTRTGTLKGKVGYMSPEQARGAAIDRRSDIFSLGVVLWELVAIRRLFKSDNDLATIQSIIHMPPPPLTGERADCPAELDRVIARALDKDPATRYQSAQELQRDLEELAREHKLNQSSIAIAAYLADVFAPEIAAWKEAQDAGSTVTITAASDLPTPVSVSELSGAEGSFLDDGGDDEPDDLDDDDPEDADAEVAVSTRAGSIRARTPAPGPELEATELAPPPIMLAELLPEPPKLPDTPVPAVPPPIDEFDQAATTVQITPFEDDPPVKPGPRPEDVPTLLTAPMKPMKPLREPPALPLHVELVGPAPLPVVAPQPPVSGPTAHDPVELMIPRRWWIIGGIVLGMVLLIAIVATALASGPERGSVASDAAISS